MLVWNGYCYFEIYYGVFGLGLVCYIINLWLFFDQIVYIVNYVEDQYVFFDLMFVLFIEGIVLYCLNVKGWVVMIDCVYMFIFSVLMFCYEELLDV